MTGKCYVAIVLDRSGSMAKIKPSVIKGYNDQVMALREDATRIETFVSFITFAGTVREEYFNSPAGRLNEMSEDQYNPSGETAMRDAVGYVIDKLCETTDQNDEYNSYLVIVISDGEENSSKLWSADRLSQRVAELNATNRWTFSYIGSNQNLEEVRRATSFPSVISFGPAKNIPSTINMSLDQGMEKAFYSNSRQMKKWLDGKANNARNYSSKDYFDGAKSVEDIAPAESLFPDGLVEEWRKNGDVA